MAGPIEREGLLRLFVPYVVTDFNENTKAEIASMVNDEGITSFKTFMAYKGALMIDGPSDWSG